MTLTLVLLYVLGVVVAARLLDRSIEESTARTIAANPGRDPRTVKIAGGVVLVVSAVAWPVLLVAMVVAALFVVVAERIS